MLVSYPNPNPNPNPIYLFPYLPIPPYISLYLPVQVSYPPFCADDPMEIYGLILKGKLSFPPSFPKHARDMVTRLLYEKPPQRLGCQKRGGRDVREHAFFQKVDFQKLEDKVRVRVRARARARVRVKPLNPKPKPKPKPNPNPNQVIKAPIIPVIKNPLDTSNYEHYEDEDGTDWARYNDKKKNVFAAF